jgi:hypothetical protein
MKNFIILSSLFIFLVSSVSFGFQNQEPVEPVDWRELQTFLADLAGFEKDGEPEGEKVSMGNMKWSRAEQNYIADNKNLNLDIIDSAYVSMALQSFKMASMMEIDTSDEYMKKIEINGYSGVKTYTYADKEAAAMVLVADRFLVRLEGGPFDDADVLVELMQELDLQGLAALAD